MRIKQCGGLFNHQSRSFHVGIGAGERELDSLILADRTIEYYSLLGITAGALDEPAAIANAFGGDQNALGVQAIEQITKTLAFFADEIFCGNFNIVKENLSGGVVHHGLNRANGKAASGGFTQIYEQNGKPFSTLFYLLDRSGARQQKHKIRMLCAGNPDFLTFDDVSV